jgi:hypothetical protein
MWIDHARAITSTTHIDNLVDAIELALTKGQPGEAYLILEDGEPPLGDADWRPARGAIRPSPGTPPWSWPETAPCSARRPRANSGIGHELAWGRDWPPWEIDRSGEGGRGKTQADAPWHTRRDAHIPAGVPSLAAITRRQQERARNWRNRRGNEIRHPSRHVRPRCADGALLGQCCHLVLKGAKAKSVRWRAVSAPGFVLILRLESS